MLVKLDGSKNENAFIVVLDPLSFHRRDLKSRCLVFDCGHEHALL